MSYDVAISMDQVALNRVIDSLFGRPNLRNRLLSGSQTTTLSGVQVTVGWEVQQAPSVTLSPPSSQQWQSAIKQDGNVPQPTQDAFIVNFPKLKVSRQKTSGQIDEETIALDAICVINLRDNKLALDPVAVIVDLSQATPNDRVIFKAILIPQILRIADSMLSGQQMPNLDFQGVQFGLLVLAVGNERIVGAANLVGKALPPVPSLSELPNTSSPFYVLLSQEAVQKIADRGIQELQGKSDSTSGSESFGIGKANYSASVRLNSISVQTSSNPTIVQANVGVSASASAGVDVFSVIGDGIVDAAKTVGEAVEDAGKAVGDFFKNIF